MAGMTDRLKTALAKVKPSHGGDHGWVEPSSSITRAVYEPLLRQEAHQRVNAPDTAAVVPVAEEQAAESDRKAGAA